MVVATKASDDPHVAGPSSVGQICSRATARLDRLPLRRYLVNNATLFSPACAPSSAAARVKAFRADLLHLHWVNNGFMRIESIKRLNAPIVWTLHDQWVFTGGCHYSADCTRYAHDCGMCPVLSSKQPADLSQTVVRRKRKAWSNVDLTLVTPSRWLATIAAQSALMQGRRIEVIPNCLDTDTFRPCDATVARGQLNLPQDRCVVLFSGLTTSTDQRKGYHLLPPALRRLSERFGDRSVCLVVAGMQAPINPEPLPFEVRYLGFLNDDVDMARAYSAADVFVAPSLQDNLPNTVMEAMSCGTPCVAFDVTGMPDLIDHRHNGYLARAYEVEDLAEGLHWVCADAARHQSLSVHARQKALSEYSEHSIAERYLALYQDVIARGSRSGRLSESVPKQPGKPEQGAR
jgi:glycosyltransferase involved in cell wall biosynthesis